MLLLQLIQFLCMCVHRMSTFLQILSITEVNDKSQIIKEDEQRRLEKLQVCYIT